MGITINSAGQLTSTTQITGNPVTSTGGFSTTGPISGGSFSSSGTISSSNGISATYYINVSADNPKVNVLSNAGGEGATGYFQYGVQRAYTGINTNSDWFVAICDDSGGYRLTPLAIQRSNGQSVMRSTAAEKTVLIIADSGSGQGANVRLDNYSWGSRYMRVNSAGYFTIINNAYTQESMALSDGGSLTTAGSIQSNNGNINAVNGELWSSGSCNANHFRPQTQSGMIMANSYWDGGSYHHWAIQCNVNYSVNFEALHIPGTQAGWRMWWANNTIIDFKDNGHIYSSNGWSSASDLRIKDGIQDINEEEALENLDKIRTITYHYTNEKERVDGRKNVRYMGYAAQDWEPFAPEVVDVAGPSNPDMPDQLTLNYAHTAPYITAALKALKREVRRLQARLDQLTE